MGTKSIREIVEAACVAHLNAQAIASGTTVLPGLNTAITDPPMVIASVESVGQITDIPQGLGNYACTLQVLVMSPSDDTGALAAHRLLGEKVSSAFDDIAGLKAVFVSQGDATCYDVTLQGIDDGRGERTFGTTFTYEVLACLAP
jgi:hypothetical protein